MEALPKAPKVAGDFAAGLLFAVCIFDVLLWHNNLMGTRQKKPITFWCEHGSHEVTEEHGPGQAL